MSHDGGERIIFKNDRLQVPDKPIIPFIEGDGTGPDIWRATRRVLDGAVQAAYQGRREIVWREVLAGEKAKQKTGEWLPAETIKTIAAHRVAIKGPLTTPVGGGIRSLNVTLRQVLDLYACVALPVYSGRPFAGQGAAKAERGDFPGKHRGRVCRH